MHVNLHSPSFIILRTVVHFPGVAGLFSTLFEASRIEFIIGDLMGESLMATVDALNPILK